MNPGLRDDNGRRESAFAGERRASPDSGRQIEIPSAGVTDREISGLLGLDHSVQDPVDRGELSIGTREGDRISTLTMSPGVVMTPSTTNGASGLIVTGYEAKSTDPIESGNIPPAASTESGFHVQSAPKDGCYGMLKTGSKQRGPDPVGGMGTSGKDVWGVGAHVRDQLRGHIPDKALLEMPDLSFTHRKRPTTLTEIQATAQLRSGPSGSTQVGEGTGLALSPVSAGEKTKDSVTEPVVGEVRLSRTVQFPLPNGEGQAEILRPPASLPSWKSLFSANSGTKSSLGFFALERVDGKPVIHPPAEAMVEGMKLWEGCLVGQFFDKRLPLHVVRAAVEKLWGKQKMPEISITDN